MTVFLGAMALGLWGFLSLPFELGVGAFVFAFLVGGIASMIVFKRLASEEQIEQDLEARLHND